MGLRGAYTGHGAMMVVLPEQPPPPKRKHGILGFCLETQQNGINVDRSWYIVDHVQVSRFN